MSNTDIKAKNSLLIRAAAVVLCTCLNPHSKLLANQPPACLNRPVLRRNSYNQTSCTAFAMVASDRGPIVGNTGDESSLSRNFFCIERLEYPDSFKFIRCRGAGVNEMGLAIGTANAHYVGKTDEGDGYARNLSLLVLRYCSSVREAVDFIKDYAILGDGHHFAIADIHGKAAAVEKGPQRLFNVRWADSRTNSRAVWITNTSPDPEMRRNFSRTVMRYPENSDNRYAYLEKAFTNADFEYTFESAEKLLFAHDPCAPICQHGKSKPEMYTTRTRLLLPAEGRLLLAARINPGDKQWRPCELRWVAEELIQLKVPSLQGKTKNSPFLTGPKGLKLSQNRPNPFRGSTIISYELAADSHVELAIFTGAGEKIITLKHETQKKGPHSVTWDGRDKDNKLLPPRPYFYRLKLADCTRTRGMTLLP